MLKRTPALVRLLAVVALVSALLLVSACSYGNSNPTPAGGTATPAKTATGNSVTISNFAFSPASISVPVGTTVTWTNKDSEAHTVASDSGVFNSGNLSTNKSFSYTFATAGVFPYHCSLHTYMKGTVTVQ
ncbi:MAG: cupredoxin family copper-binding protein [Dehalococcoidia bacterium]|nr:cupredoxin family copper-binding protein [Dehalococcoidia bacterium]